MAEVADAPLWTPPPGTQVMPFNWGRYMHSPGVAAQIGPVLGRRPVFTAFAGVPEIDIAVTTSREATDFEPMLQAGAGRIALRATLADPDLPFADVGVLPRLHATWLGLFNDLATAIQTKRREQYDQHVGKLYLALEALVGLEIVVEAIATKGVPLLGCCLAPLIPYAEFFRRRGRRIPESLSKGLAALAIENIHQSYCNETPCSALDRYNAPLN
jgi:hypothetical protein